MLALCHSLSMHEQNQIASTLASADGTARLKDLLAQAGSASRAEMGRRVCQAFGFHDVRGRPQLAGCMKALRALDAHGHIQLPAPRHERRLCRPRRLGQPVPAPTEVPARADWVRGLALVEVTGDDQRRVWNELMQREHPRGAARHVGAQLRYLLVSDHGVLGALGFAASALTLAARDAFIGWDADLRCRQLHRVVALSRFLIRPSVRCRNLASKALGLCLRRLPDDFQRRYGYRPLLVETFVEKDRHAGTSLAAANWLRVGETAGRGRFAAPATRVPVKAVYLYPLARDWRTQLGVAAPSAPPALGPGEGLARDEWAAHEFGSASLGDVRWSKRLVKSAQIQSEAPTKSFLGAAQKDLAAVKGHYRLIDQPADSAVTPENILAPHRQRTLRRMQGQPAVLCIQDGTDLNFAEHGGCVGLGQIGKNSNAQGTLGLHMHSTLVVTGEGIPLGVPHIQYEAPDGQAEKGKPLQERKTWRWIRGLRACAELAGELDGVRPVSVMDREADVFALFAEQRRLGTVDLLVRAKHNRSLGKDLPKLFETVRAEAAQARLEIHVGRLSARRGSRGQKGREEREERAAQVELRWQAVELPDPERGAAAARLNLVHVREETEPEGAERLEWFLLTTLTVESRQDAERVLEWYRLRWRIEDWHRVLKSGCKVEYLAHRTGERIERAVTINAVIAWRLAAMTLLGRDTPELPAGTLFSDIEIAALEDFAQDRKLPPPDNVGRAVLTTAMLGGYLNFKRKRYAGPGHQVLWEGYTRLATIVQACERSLRLNQDSKLYQRLRRNKTYG